MRALARVGRRTAHRKGARAPRPLPNFAALLALLALAPTACAPASGDGAAEVELALETAPDPPEVGPARILLRMSTPEGAPVQGASVEIEGNMAHAGMVPVFATAEELAPGEYAAELELSMGGDWFLLVDATLADGRELRRKLDLLGVGAR